jgi:tRNA pseudouridine32 synthase/23S rRNA pseudouridine746 synthase
MTPEEMQARLLYRDGLILVIDKPAGVPVHRGPKGGPSLEDDFDALRFGLPRAPALAHRLDRDTSGCLVLVRHRKALETVGSLFRHGKVSKTYWAVVEGGPEAETGEIDLPLGRLDAGRGWWMKVDTLAGLPSKTLWTVRGRGAHQGAPIAWIEFQPLTGRTHQLRVHASAMGWPIVGDPIYGSAARDGALPLQLHARAISIPLARNKPPVAATAPVPPHMQALLGACGWNADLTAP